MPNLPDCRGIGETAADGDPASFVGARIYGCREEDCRHCSGPLREELDGAHSRLLRMMHPVMDHRDLAPQRFDTLKQRDTRSKDHRGAVPLAWMQPLTYSRSDREAPGHLSDQEVLVNEHSPDAHVSARPNTAPSPASESKSHARRKELRSEFSLDLGGAFHDVHDLGLEDDSSCRRQGSQKLKRRHQPCPAGLRRAVRSLKRGKRLTRMASFLRVLQFYGPTSCRVVTGGFDGAWRRRAVLRTKIASPMRLMRAPA